MLIRKVFSWRQCRLGGTRETRPRRQGGGRVRYKNENAIHQLGLTILDYAVQILVAAAFALFVVTVRAGVNYLTAKVGGEKVPLAMQLAATVVRALEQQGELLGFDGPRKKEMATRLRQLVDNYSDPCYHVVC